MDKQTSEVERERKRRPDSLPSLSSIALQQVESVEADDVSRGCSNLERRMDRAYHKLREFFLGEKNVRVVE
jgi:hypothetical protein